MLILVRHGSLHPDLISYWQALAGHWEGGRISLSSTPVLATLSTLHVRERRLSVIVIDLDTGDPIKLHRMSSSRHQIYVRAGIAHTSSTLLCDLIKSSPSYLITVSCIWHMPMEHFRVMYYYLVLA